MEKPISPLFHQIDGERRRERLCCLFAAKRDISLVRSSSSTEEHISYVYETAFLPFFVCMCVCVCVCMLACVCVCVLGCLCVWFCVGDCVGMTSTVYLTGVSVCVSTAADGPPPSLTLSLSFFLSLSLSHSFSLSLSLSLTLILSLSFYFSPPLSVRLSLSHLSVSSCFSPP